MSSPKHPSAILILLKALLWSAFPWLARRDIQRFAHAMVRGTLCTHPPSDHFIVLFGHACAAAWRAIDEARRSATAYLAMVLGAEGLSHMMRQMGYIRAADLSSEDQKKILCALGALYVKDARATSCQAARAIGLAAVSYLMTTTSVLPREGQATALISDLPLQEMVELVLDPPQSLQVLMAPPWERPPFISPSHGSYL